MLIPENELNQWAFNLQAINCQLISRKQEIINFYYI